MPKVCNRCKQYSRVTPHASPDGKVKDLCKTCNGQVDLEELLSPTSHPCPMMLRGRVMGLAAGVKGVRVGVHSMDRWTWTDEAGAFALGNVAFDVMASAISELYSLTERDSSGCGCEHWMRAAIDQGHLPCEYEAALRRSEIGAPLDHDTFVDLLTRNDVAYRIARHVFSALRREPTIVLSFTKEGHVPFSLLLAISEHLFAATAPLEVKMQPVTKLGTLDATTGGCLNDARTGASVTLASCTKLVTLDGSPFEGKVIVSCSVIDVMDPKAVEDMPGDYSAVDAHGNAGQLESFGAMYVGLRTTDGESLELANDSPGMALSLTTSAPVAFKHTDVPPSLYKFDEVSAKWIQDTSGVLDIEGVVMPNPALDQREVFVKPVPKLVPKPKGKMRKGGDEFHGLNHFGFTPGAQVWTKQEFEKLLGRQLPRTVSVRNVPNTGFWNCDRMMETCFVSGRVLDAEGAPLTVANVFSKGVSYCGTSPRSGLTPEGCFSILAQSHSKFEVIVLVPMSHPESDALQTSNPVKFGFSRKKGVDSARFQFGPFETKQPLKELDIGELRLGTDSHIPEVYVQKQKMLCAFKEWDGQDKGYLNKQDFAAKLQTIGKNDEEVHNMFLQADVSKEGKIDWEKFERWLLNDPDNLKLLDMEEMRSGQDE